MTEADIMVFLVMFLMAAAIQLFVVIFLVWLLKKRQVWALIMAAIKGHGTVFCKSHYNRAVEFKYTDKPENAVVWKVRDKATGKIKEIRTYIDKIYHTLKGTGINMHFCPITYPSNIDLNSKEKTSLDPEKISAIMAQEYIQGAQDATNFQRLGGLNIEHLQVLLMVIQIVMMIVLFYMIYSIQATLQYAPT